MRRQEYNATGTQGESLVIGTTQVRLSLNSGVENRNSGFLSRTVNHAGPDGSGTECSRVKSPLIEEKHDNLTPSPVESAGILRADLPGNSKVPSMFNI